MFVLSIILQSLLILYYVFSGVSKIIRIKYWVDVFNNLKLPQWFRTFTGFVQIIGAVGLIIGFWYAGAVIWASIWLGATMIVAFFAHVRVKDSVRNTVPPLVFLAMIATVIIINAL